MNKKHVILFIKREIRSLQKVEVDVKDKLEEISTTAPLISFNLNTGQILRLLLSISEKYKITFSKNSFRVNGKNIDIKDFTIENIVDVLESKFYNPTNSKVFFISDTHFSHKNLIKCLTSWTDQDPCRDFKSIEDMDDTIINNINSVVGVDDELYHLGDFAICNIKYWWKLRQRIKCKTIHLIVGNHDPKGELFSNSLIKLPLEDQTEERDSFFTHELFTTIQFVGEPKIQIPGTNQHQRVVLSHYSHRTWNKAHHGSYMLYGHSHGSMYEYVEMGNNIGTEIYYKTGRKYKTMDVGVDTHPEFRPYSFQEIIDIFSQPEYINLGIDHHKAGEDTNGV